MIQNSKSFILAKLVGI